MLRPIGQQIAPVSISEQRIVYIRIRKAGSSMIKRFLVMSAVWSWWLVKRAINLFMGAGETERNATKVFKLIAGSGLQQGGTGYSNSWNVFFEGLNKFVLLPLNIVPLLFIGGNRPVKTRLSGWSPFAFLRLGLFFLYKFQLLGAHLKSLFSFLVSYKSKQVLFTPGAIIKNKFIIFGKPFIKKLRFDAGPLSAFNVSDGVVMLWMRLEQRKRTVYGRLFYASHQNGVSDQKIAAFTMTVL